MYLSRPSAFEVNVLGIIYYRSNEVSQFYRSIKEIFHRLREILIF